MMSHILGNQDKYLEYNRLREVLHYDQETGIFTRLESAGNRKKGMVVGSANGRGYLFIKVDNVRHQAHRLAFFYMTRSWPAISVDHIDGSKGNNSWRNLRLATYRQNGSNRGVQKNNTSGLKGVQIEYGKYRADIKVSYRKIWLGYFDCPAAASFAYQVAADKFNGEFARHR